MGIHGFGLPVAQSSRLRVCHHLFSLQLRCCRLAFLICVCLLGDVPCQVASSGVQRIAALHSHICHLH